MFSRTATVLFVAVFSISWSQEWLVHMHHRDYEPLYPTILDLNHEYMDPKDDMGSLPPSYENLVRRLYTYLVSPKEKYIKVLSKTSFLYEQSSDYEESDDVTNVLKNVSVEDALKNPNMRSRFVFGVIQIALIRLPKSCDELEKTISLSINNESMPLENATGLNTEEKQFDMKVILVEAKSAKLVLQDLQNRLNFYTENVLVARRLGKKIGGLSLQGLLRYTVSAMTSVRGSWIDWKMMSHFSNVAEV